MRVSREERRWALWFGAALMLLTTIPYFLAYAAAGQEWVFTGFLFGVEDGNSYIAKMLSGASGNWLFRTPYTTMPQKGLIVLMPYVLLGKLAAAPALHLQMTALYHLFRVGAGLAAVLAGYEFLSVFIQELRLRRWGLVLLTLGGGLGWLLALLGQDWFLGSLPLDYYSPESFGFLSLYGIPHLALARALLLWGLARFLRAAPEEIGWRALFQSDRTGLLIGLGWLLLGLMQPLTVVVGWGVLAVFLLALLAVQSRQKAPAWGRFWGDARRAGWAVLCSSPMVLYTVIAFAIDPFAKAWTAQNILPSPHIAHYLLAYGLVLPYAWVGARRLLKVHPWRGWLAAGWLAVLPIWVYAPVGVQRRLAEGVWAALVVLALAAFEGREKPRFYFRPVVLSFTLVSSVFLLYGGILSALKPSEPLFRPAAEIEFFTAVGREVETGDIVLGDYQTGNALPAWAPVRVVIGHGPENIDLPRLRPLVADFYSISSSDESRIDLFEDQQIDYIVWGPRERDLGDWSPEGAAYLEKVLSMREYSLFRVNYSALGP